MKSRKKEHGKIRKSTEEVEKNNNGGRNEIEWRVLEGGDQV